MLGRTINTFVETAALRRYRKTAAAVRRRCAENPGHDRATALLRRAAEAPVQERPEDLLAALVVLAEAHHGFRVHDVQIAGALALLENRVIEMATGEGKTLVAALAAALRVCRGEQVHVATANDYLAGRDGAYASALLRPAGIRVAHLTTQTPVAVRGARYQAQIVYATLQQFGFDYLRDHLALQPDQCVQRDRETLMVDEADALLIDEAATPMIISQPDSSGAELSRLAFDLSGRLEVHVCASEADQASVDPESCDALGDLMARRVILTERGYRALAAHAAEHGLAHEERELYGSAGAALIGRVQQALAARALYLEHRDYLLRDGRVVIIDPHTGRLLAERRWDEGLHQLVEIKHGLEPSEENRAVGRVRVMEFVHGYHRLCGMSGTAHLGAEHFSRLYGLSCLRLPTAAPVARRQEPDRVFMGTRARDQAVVEDVLACVDRGQPVLIGTQSVAESERVSRLLRERAVAHDVLNAREHEREAAIIAEAGAPSQVTVATGMAGRGTDIVLGGQAKAAAHPGRDARQAVVHSGGLRVIGVGRHFSARVDAQLRGRCARQGDPGSSVFYVSLDEGWVAKTIGPRLARLWGHLGVSADDAVCSAWVGRQIAATQARLEQQSLEGLRDEFGFEAVRQRQMAAFHRIRAQWLHGAKPADILSRRLAEEVRGLMARPVDALLADEGAAGRAVAAWGLRAVIERGDAGDCEGRTQAALAMLDQRAEVMREQLGDHGFEQLAREVVLAQADAGWAAHLEALEDFARSAPLAALARQKPQLVFAEQAHAGFVRLVAGIETRASQAWARVLLRSEEGTLVRTGT